MNWIHEWLILPEQASTLAPNIDNLFMVCDSAMSIFFFVLVVSLILFFVKRYRRRSADEYHTAHHAQRNALEIVWSVIPLFLLMTSSSGASMAT